MKTPARTTREVKMSNFNPTVYPKTWWYSLAEKLVPDRCREVPHARDSGRVLIRQVALVKRRAYLQQFASSEFDASEGLYYHTHPWRLGTIAIGLYGELEEIRPRGVSGFRRWVAPYVRYMGPNFMHMSAPVKPGHTSLFIGLGLKTDSKFYHRADEVHWSEYIKTKVKRL